MLKDQHLLFLHARNELISNQMGKGTKKVSSIEFDGIGQSDGLS